MLRLSLYDLVGVAVVIDRPTGVVYTNQTGGHACLQPEQEGALLPVNSDGPERGPNELEERLREVFAGAGHFNDDLANQIDAILARYPQTSGIEVDRSRLRSSHEAWVHVLIEETEGGGLSGASGGLSGVLTWPNSD